MGDDSRRVELISERQANRTSNIGLGLLASLAVGFGPLSDAIQGNGSFESAIGRFVACVVVCVGAAAVLGHLLDSAPARQPAQRRTGGVGTEPTGQPTQPAGNTSGSE